MMFPHRQRFAAVQLHRELGRQLGKTRRALQAAEDLACQRPCVDHLLRIDARGRAEHQVAHVVTGGIRWPKAQGQQRLDQRLMRRADATNLQVAAVGGLNHAAGITVRHVRHCLSLLRGDQATCQLDATNATVHRLDDAQ